MAEIGFAALGITVSIATMVGGLTSVDGPSASADTVDISNMNSTWREFKKSLVDGGELSLGLNYDPASHNGVAAMLHSADLKPVIIVWPDTAMTNTTFDALVTGFAPNGEIDGALNATVTLKVSGAITWG